MVIRDNSNVIIVHKHIVEGDHPQCNVNLQSNFYVDDYVRTTVESPNRLNTGIRTIVSTISNIGLSLIT